MQYRHSRKGINMIKINHLTITQNKDLRDLISDLNITIQDGEKVAIIGEEGNGKSTLLKTLMGERLADFTIRGEIQSDLQSLAYIPQKLAEDLKKKTLHDYFFLDSADKEYCSLNQQNPKRSSRVESYFSGFQGVFEECRPVIEDQIGCRP